MKGIEPNGESDGVRRSTRLKAAPSKTVKVNRERDKRTTRSRSATSSASGATIEVPVSSPLSMDTQLQLAADDWLRDVVRRSAMAYRALSMYRCQEALREVDTLPVELQKSPWALDIVARSFYEMSKYVTAVRLHLADTIRLAEHSAPSSLSSHTVSSPQNFTPLSYGISPTLQPYPTSLNLSWPCRGNRHRLGSQQATPSHSRGTTTRR
jgi:anaphase-promoting complex subunit 3